MENKISVFYYHKMRLSIVPSQEPAALNKNHDLCLLSLD
jgi:hypothetical protein